MWKWNEMKIQKLSDMNFKKSVSHVLVLMKVTESGDVGITFISCFNEHAVQTGTWCNL